MSLADLSGPPDLYDYGVLHKSADRVFTFNLKLGAYDAGEIDVVYELAVIGPESVDVRNIRLLEEDGALYAGRWRRQYTEHPLNGIEETFPGVALAITRACWEDADKLSFWEIAEMM